LSTILAPFMVSILGWRNDGF